MRGSLLAVAAVEVSAAYAGMYFVAPHLGGSVVAFLWSGEAALPVVVVRASRSSLTLT